MSKRVADKYLTDQNWDQDDEEEDVSGCFRKADDDVLKSRVIRKAKRRVVGSQPTSGSAFSGFSGLKAQSASSSFRGFNLPGGSTKSEPAGTQMKAFGNFVPPGSSAATQFKLQPSSGGTAIVAPQSETMTVEKQQSKSTVFSTPANDVKSSDEDETTQNSQEYNRHLSALNKSVSEWIKNHVEKNPLCDLTPIFQDYKKHLSEIDEKFGLSDHETTSQNSFQVSDSQDTVSPKSSKNSSRSSNASERSKFALTGFGQKQDNTKEKEAESQNPAPSRPLFGGPPASTAPAINSSPFKGFNVGNKPPPVLPGFSFSSSMVGGNDATAPKPESSGGGEEEYVPPKPESNIVEEKDAFFTIRCKLYYKKEAAFADRGVGQLYLKPSGDKTQLLVRADTAVGHILLNILLQPSIPMLRQGKNNVMITCIPNPPINEKEKDKVVPMLIRVKTSDDADRLLQIMEENKQESQKDG